MISRWAIKVHRYKGEPRDLWIACDSEMEFMFSVFQYLQWGYDIRVTIEGKSHEIRQKDLKV